MFPKQTFTFMLGLLLVGFIKVTLLGTAAGNCYGFADLHSGVFSKLQVSKRERRRKEKV